MSTASSPALAARSVTAGYDGRTVLDCLSLDVPQGRITALVGPNACGKSTLLKSLARLLPVAAGTVLLDGRDIHALPTREVARRLGILPQSPLAPEGITVADLVQRGRHPHQRFGVRRGTADDLVIARALQATGTEDLAGRPVDELSGGQRQRVWIALALAQETPTLLLDEPTTYLDIAHQIEVMDLLADLNERTGKTIVLVSHDLNQAALYASTIVAMRDGRIVRQGTPHEVLTERTVSEVFGLDCLIVPHPRSDRPQIFPMGRRHLDTTQENHPC
ncbi:ABC transporter ATP-binding protein [Streptomyces antibioticus]|uniref:ABC transporter ATP-binding protein n=1 Tax=Streptomyces antibioticus TaxID=1890 RepID=A0AAE6YEB9_STRAT|nr:ABC transporter ATP-binding protein [Streptomyces antibioticus]OOQ47861.1 iron dicitrate ABC transporter ATP-binding protein [Streptomyces antibioticus]QIT48190.1 ABC transporter ATP-binding protein [Streptomyces antibioticus]